LSGQSSLNAECLFHQWFSLHAKLDFPENFEQGNPEKISKFSSLRAIQWSFLAKSA
jgi:hypothetical protein